MPHLVEELLVKLEKIHQKLNKVRHSSKKEFFSVSVPEAINTIRGQLGDKIKYEEVFHTTPEELKKASSRKTTMASLKVFSSISYSSFLVDFKETFLIPLTPLTSIL